MPAQVVPMDTNSNEMENTPKYPHNGVNDRDIVTAQEDIEDPVSMTANPSSILNPRCNLTIAYKDVTVTVANKAPKSDFDYRLKNVSGVIHPSTMTLVLAPPGHGKSTLLRLLANRVPLHNGQVLYNSRTPEESLAAGIDVNKAVQYMEQTDAHIPLLTVQETLDFVQSVGCRIQDPRRVEEAISAMGLAGCRDTIVGNVLIRGVSGGERRRVSIAEALLGDACALFLDEYTNGLDSVTSEKITAFLREWVTRTHASIVATAQQPTPGLVALFDDIIVLKDSQVIYHGPREDVLPYFRSMGFSCPADVDMCDFVIDCVSQPKVAFRRQAAMLVDKAVQADAANKVELQEKLRALIDTDDFAPGTWEWTLGDAKAAIAIAVDSPTANTDDAPEEGMLCEHATPAATPALTTTPCLTTDTMIAHFHASGHAQRMRATLATLAPPKHEYAMEEAFAPGYLHSVPSLLGKVLARQGMLARRNKTMYIPRIVQTLVVSLIGGSVFYMISPDSYYERIAMFSFMMNMFTYVALSELPMAIQTASVVYKHAAANMYPVWTHVVSNFLCNMPLLALEVSLLVLIVYFMVDNVAEAGAFFMVLCITYLTALTSNAYFHMLTAINNTEATALAIASPSVGILFLCSGFFVTRTNLPDFMIWVYWISPWSWGMRALVNIEFLSSRYAAIAAGSTVSWGEKILDNFDFQVGREWVGYGALFLVGLIVVMLWNQARMMRKPFFELSIGTRRNTDSDLSAKTTASLHTLTEELKFRPAVLTFKNLVYTVQVQKDAQTIDKVLLQDVCGHAQPGKLTALMGASGAGKTTLLDVLAGQKTQGTVDGSIRINGQDLDPLQRSRVTGYVEQFDDMCPFLTIEETLMFSANLRLPPTVTEQQKRAIVAEILAILELNDMKDRLIGSALVPSLSPSQLKRVSIGVELVANPSILFLDEPTTGLDAKAALTVMSVVKRIAEAGRTIICTIHQPNAELFYLFDQLVLLAPGGHQVFFGELGPRSSAFSAYLSAIPDVAPLENQQNPASWMLEQLSAPPKDVDDANVIRKMVSERQMRFSEYYKSSPVCATALADVDRIDEQHLGDANQNMARIKELLGRSLGLKTQFTHVFRRTVLSYLRNVKGLIGRFMVTIILGIVYGCIYFDLQPTTQTSTLNAVSARANSVSFNGLMHSILTLTAFKAARSFVYREHMFGFYQVPTYVLSTMFCEILLCAFDAFLLQIPLYFMSDFTQTAQAFFEYYFALFWVNICVVSGTFLISTIFASPALIGVVQSAYMTLSVLFAGMTVSYAKAPRGWSWMFYVSPFGRGTEAIAYTQFATCSPLPDCGPMISVLDGDKTVQMTVSRYVASYLGYDYGGYWDAVGVLIGWTAFFIIASCFTMHFLTHRNK